MFHNYDTGCLDEESLGIDEVVEHGVEAMAV